ncbi:MAG: polysaccharide biosynthesis protein [Lachnospiraceae bacterium]|nr:polysaccharide biosynthesis protein [Lachnospiraceae bacterium]
MDGNYLKHSIKINYVYKLFYEILSFAAPLITVPYVSRVLNADGIGRYSFSHSLYTYFSLFAVLGTASYGMREVSRCRDDKEKCSKVFWEIEIVSVFTTSICIFLWIVFVFWGDLDHLLYMAYIPALVATMLDISWFYMGIEKVMYISIVNGLFRIVGVFCVFLFVIKAEDLYKYVLIQALTSLGGNALMWIFLPQLITKVDYKKLVFSCHIVGTLKYFIPAIASSIYTVLDKTLIGVIGNNDFENGYYEQASKIIHIGKVLSFSAFNSVMEARISYLFMHQKIEEIKTRIMDSFDFIMFLAVGFVCGINAVVTTFVPLFFGAGYEEVIMLIIMQSPLVVIVGITNCIGSHYYTPAGYRVKSAKYLIYGSIVNVFLNIMLIPFWGAKGASVASVIAEGIIATLYIHNCEGFLSIRQAWRSVYKKIIAGMCMIIGVSLYNHFSLLSGTHLLLTQVLVGALSYFILLILLRDTFIVKILNTVGLVIKHSKRE